MKFNLTLPTSAALLLLLASLTASPAQNLQNLPGAPVIPAPVDPMTGMPSAQPQFEEWISSDWKDPEITLTNVDYDGLPVTEIARDLKEKFKDKFDVVLTPGWTDKIHEPFDLQSVVVKIQLKNVTASEVFRAMNINFEAQNSPVRWQLTVNGKRPMVLLRVLPNLLPTATHGVDPTTGLPAGTPPPPADLKKPMVFYVGDLIGDEKSGGMTMAQISDTLSQVNKMAYGDDVFLGFHKEAQLVIVRGTPDQIAFVSSTLEALKQKKLSALDKMPAGGYKKTEAPTTGGGTN